MFEDSLIYGIKNSQLLKLRTLHHVFLLGKFSVAHRIFVPRRLHMRNRLTHPQ